MKARLSLLMRSAAVATALLAAPGARAGEVEVDRKSTRLNSSHWE